MKERLRVPVDGTEIKDKGYRIRVHSLSNIRRRMAGRVARHEAKHAYVAEETGTQVLVATNIPGSDGSLGHVETAEFNAMAAAAPFATGEDGTGRDVFMIETRGESVGAAASGAKSVLSGRDEEVEAVASLIEEKGSAGGSEIRQEIKRVREEKTQGRKFLVEITTPTGEEQKMFKMGIHEGEGIELSLDELLPRAA